MKKTVLAVVAAMFCVGTAYGASTVLFRLPPYRQVTNLLRSVHAPDSTDATFYTVALTQFRAVPTQAETVMVGDSLTAMGQWNELLPNVSLVNRAIAGDTGAGILKRLDTIRSTKAKRAIIMFGVNDLRGSASDDEVFANYSKVIATLPMKVVVQSTFPTAHASLNERIASLNARLKAFCSTGRCTYLDTARSVTVDGNLNPAMTVDGVHLNGSGYVAWAAALRDGLAVGTN